MIHTNIDDCLIIDSKTRKIIKSPEFNLYFNKITGLTKTWGKTHVEDPKYCKYGPIIADIEISEICNGINGKPCTFCYKSNTSNGNNMSYETFKKIVDKYPKTLTQIALGIGDIDSNPDIYAIMRYCRQIDIVPNVTINGSRMLNGDYERLTTLCGAVAVSHYDDDICFNAINELTSRGMKQVNIHKLLCNETFDSCLDLIDKIKNDNRLKKMNALVFLFLKPKGNRNKFTILDSFQKYEILINKCLDNKIKFGFDSCSAFSFIQYLNKKIDLIISDFKNKKISIDEYLKKIFMYENMKIYTTSCESNLESLYCNSQGVHFHCSFTEGEKGWNGIDMLSIENFNEVWQHNEVNKFRDMLFESNEKFGCRKCPIFNLELKS